MGFRDTYLGMSLDTKGEPANERKQKKREVCVKVHASFRLSGQKSVGERSVDSCLVLPLFFWKRRKDERSCFVTMIEG